MQDERYLTIQDIVKRLQISEKTVRRWVTEKDPGKRLPSILIGRKYRVLESDLKIFLEKLRKM